MTTLGNDTTISTPSNAEQSLSESKIAASSVQGTAVTPENLKPARYAVHNTAESVPFDLVIKRESSQNKALRNPFNIQGPFDGVGEGSPDEEWEDEASDFFRKGFADSLGRWKHRPDAEPSRLVEDWCQVPERAEEDEGNVQRDIPHILWRVGVYRTDIGGQKYPTVTYRNDRPYNLSLCEQLHTNAQRPPETSDGERRDGHATSRNEPVFEVETRVLEQAAATRSMPQPPGDHRESVDQLQIAKITKTRIIIHSKVLSDALASLLSYYPAHPMFDLLSVISEPYDILMHHYEAIENFANSVEDGKDTENTNSHESIDVQPSKLAVEHMKLLYNFLRPRYDSRIKPCLDSLSRRVPEISFDMLWYLFRPGIDVYAQMDDMISVCVVRAVTSNLDETEWLSSITPSVWNIEAWDLVTNGARIGRSKVVHHIRSYTGLRKVTSLPICPVSYWDATDNGARRKQILQRSRIYVEALRAGNMLVNYNGPDLSTQRHYKGKVVVDVRRALTYDTERKFIRPDMQNVADNYPKFAQYDHIYVNESEYVGDRDEEGAPDGDLESDSRFSTTEITEHQLLLLFPTTFAFAISSKQWMEIRVDQMQAIQPSSDSIMNLVIGKDELDTIRALSNQQSSKYDSWSADFIAGKGSGQIILLHGPPGVGKTYTVESIAEWLHRPLLALTVADIGTRETKIEAELLKWFDLAEAWNAILLVDEADIFLEQRKNRDLARNGLVSAFLRRMEYFNGLLFLTTNRVGQIDDAFISRVHVAIAYPPLTADIRRKIWTGFFKKLVKERAGKVKVTINAKKWVLDNIDGQDELNGRDIRNALQTAVRLAEFEALEDPDHIPNESIVVEEAHFRRVLDMSNKFHKYVNSIRKEDEAKRAGLRGDRNDYLTEGEENVEWPKLKEVRFE